MKKGILISFSILFVFGLFSCERKEVKNKIIEGIPIDTTTSVIPAKAIQEMMLLKRDAFSIVVPIINRLPLSGATFPNVVASRAIKGTALVLCEERRNIEKRSVKERRCI